MYVFKSTDIKDLMEAYDKEDLFNSSIVYILPRLKSQKVRVSYRCREDLISESLYDEPTLMSLILMNNSESKYKPGDVIQFKSKEELVQSLNRQVSVVADSVRNRSTDRAPKYERLIYENGKFKPEPKKQG